MIRVAIWDGAGRRLALGRAGLPAVDVDPAESAPSAVAGAVRGQLGLEAAFLRRAASGAAELEHLDGRLPPGLAWHDATPAPAWADRVAWQRPGWFRAMVRTVDLALGARGILRTDRAEQVRHGGISAILRFETDRGPLWCKAVPPLFAHEARVIAWLAAATPHAVPELVARGDTWWIASQLPDEDGPAREDFLEALGRLQVASAGRARELASIGCPDRPLGRLTGEVEQLAARSDIVGPEQAASLRETLAPLASLCREAESLQLPPTLVHGDLHAGNTRWTARGWLLFDWTDACIAHPFVDLALPLSQERPRRRGARAAAYGEIWRGLCSPYAVDRAIRMAATIGAAHQAVSYRRIIDAVGSSVSDHTLRRARDWVRELTARLR